MLIARHGFEGVYVSGAVIAADLGLPDIGLTTLAEVAGRAQQIARVTALPSLVDADTGFGFDTPTFTPIFAVARLPGWTAHIAEQLAANSLIRPLAAYNGTSERHLSST
jgi:2-methylisocitrate lyase-like PEP mutase family enzyme